MVPHRCLPSLARARYGCMAAPGASRRSLSRGVSLVLPERVTILAEQALKPSEINVAEAQAEQQHAQDLYNQAGDDQRRYDEANAVSRVAEEKLTSAHAKSA